MVHYILLKPSLFCKYIEIDFPMLCHHTRYVVLCTDLGILYVKYVMDESMVIAPGLDASNMVKINLIY